MAIKRLGEGEKDQPSTHKELFLLFQEMDEWESLDQRLVCVMREIHAESVRIAEDDKLEVVITYMLKLVALQNGVANCSRHALGCKWRAVHDRHEDDKGNKERIGSSLDMLQDNLNNAVRPVCSVAGKMWVRGMHCMHPVRQNLQSVSI
jgi:hypothetical protein